MNILVGLRPRLAGTGAGAAPEHSGIPRPPAAGQLDLHHGEYCVLDLKQM